MSIKLLAVLMVSAVFAVTPMVSSRAQQTPSSFSPVVEEPFAKVLRRIKRRNHELWRLI